MDLIDLEDDSIDAEVMDSLAVTMDDFRVSFLFIEFCQSLMLVTFMNSTKNTTDYYWENS